MRRDCKEKEELIQRVLESSARALLPDLELDEMVIVDDEDSEADSSSGGEKDDGAQSAAEEAGEAA